LPKAPLPTIFNKSKSATVNFSSSGFVGCGFGFDDDFEEKNEKIDFLGGFDGVEVAFAESVLELTVSLSNNKTKNYLNKI
jgi:hypothetical protein